MYCRYYEVLDNEEQQTCLRLLEEPTWQFAGHSAPDGYTFWYKNLIDNNFFNNVFLNKINAITRKKFIAERIYANGQTHGLPGSLHRDDIRKNSWTFLYYANPHWEIEWGGDTVFFNDSSDYTFKIEEKYSKAIYLPNTAIIFKGSLLHAGLEPTRHFKGLRITVAFKLLEEEENI